MMMRSPFGGRWMLLALVMTSCALHQAQEYPEPDAERPAHFQAEAPPQDFAVDARGHWWAHFGRVDLDGLVTTALSGNQELGASWARLAAARALLVAADAADELQVNLGADAGLTTNAVQSDRTSDRRDEVFRYGVGLSARYALDVWGRIEAGVKASALDALAAREAVSSTALLLSGEVTNAWLDMLLSEGLLKIVREQELTSLQLLELTELRFANGLGTALDVLQQRSQLAAVTSDIPLFEADKALARHRLSVLMGRAPGAPLEADGTAGLPALPPAVAIGVPRDLLAQRPDLRAARARLEAADQRVAAAVAALLPDFTLALDYDASKGRGPGLFDLETGRFVLELLQPVLNGERLEAEIARTKAVVQEAARDYAATWLIALREVEDALVREARQAEFVGNVQRRVDLARATLAEARARYGNGEGNFIDVLTAVGSLQDLERLALRAQRELLGIRVALHLALGGDWMAQLTSASSEASPLEP